MPDEKLPLIVHPGSGLARLGPPGGRIVAEMVSGALTLSRSAEAISAALDPRFRIGDHGFCEPDYRQILLWAKALDLEPATVIERLLIAPEWEPDQNKMTRIVNGRIIKLGWNLKLLPLIHFAWLDGLVIESVAFFDQWEFEGNHHYMPQRVLSFALPELRRLDCRCLGLSGIDLSGVPRLRELSCGQNELSELDISSVPDLSILSCGDNLLSSLDLSAVPQLTQLACPANRFTELDLSAVPRLTHLACGHNEIASLNLSGAPCLIELLCLSNKLRSLDLSGSPLLTKLWCNENQLAELDIRPLTQLKDLNFESDNEALNPTCLIQRPDQNF